MDYLLSVHSPQRILIGAPPTDPQEYLKSFLLALGPSVSIFARNRRLPNSGSTTLPKSKKGARGLKITSPVKDIFRQHYLYNGPLALTRPNIIAMLAVATKAKRTSWPSVNLLDFNQEISALKEFTTLQLLAAVREGVASKEMHLKFDYFTFH